MGNASSRAESDLSNEDARQLGVECQQIAGMMPAFYRLLEIHATIETFVLPDLYHEHKLDINYTRVQLTKWEPDITQGERPRLLEDLKQLYAKDLDILRNLEHRRESISKLQAFKRQFMHLMEQCGLLESAWGAQLSTTEPGRGPGSTTDLGEDAEQTSEESIAPLMNDTGGLSDLANMKEEPVDAAVAATMGTANERC